MPYRTIEENDWSGYFQYVSRMIQGQNVEIEVIGMEFGDQIEEEWATLEGLSYDRKEDILYVHTPPLEHAIPGPFEVVVLEDEGLALRSISVKSANDRLHTFYLREIPRLEWVQPG